MEVNNKGSNRRVKYLVERDEELLLKSCKNIKHKLAILLQIDCGPRISEIRVARIKDFNFQKKEYYVLSLKKGKDKNGEKKEVWRTVELSDRTVQTAAKYFKESKLNIKDPNQLLFPSPMTNEPITRQQFWRYLKEISDKRTNPHMLRHTFATKLHENGVSLVTIRDLLGHENTRTTEVYAHASEEKKKLAVRTLHKKSKLKEIAKRMFPRLFQPKDIHVLPTIHGWTTYHIGRKEELRQLRDYTTKKVNVIVMGEQGSGKSHLLSNYTDSKILRIDDTKDFKKTLANMIIKIIDESKNELKIKKTDIITDEETGEQITLLKSSKEIIAEMLNIDTTRITTYSAKNLTDLLLRLTETNEYTLIIDRVDDVTPSVIKQLEFLRNHFHFIVAARSIKTEQATWLTNFQKINLKNLNYGETMELIVRASEPFRSSIQDFDIYKTGIWAKSQGNPQFTLESIDYFSKLNHVNIEDVANYEHIGSIKEWDMTLPLLVILGCSMLFRYIGGELGHDEDAFRLFGALGMISLLFGRNLFRMTKKRYI